MISLYKEEPKYFHNWCETKSCINHMTLDGHLRSSGLKSMRAEDHSEVEMVLAVNCYVQELSHSKKDHGLTAI
jgi:hypothetical protein